MENKEKEVRDKSFNNFCKVITTIIILAIASPIVLLLLFLVFIWTWGITCLLPGLLGFIVELLILLATVAFLISLVVMILRRMFMSTDEQYDDFYFKEWPVSCPSCGSHFSIVAGSAKACPYCGRKVYVSHEGVVSNSEDCIYQDNKKDDINL